MEEKRRNLSQNKEENSFSKEEKQKFLYGEDEDSCFYYDRECIEEKRKRQRPERL